MYVKSSILDARNYIASLPPRNRQDFNVLFGYKHDPATNAVISGVSPDGKLFTKREIN